MTRVLEILLLNAASASLLALLVFSVGRVCRRPGVLHVGWMLVLLKLVTPPVIEIAAFPRIASTAGSVPAAVASNVTYVSAPAGLPPALSSRHASVNRGSAIGWRTSVLSIWLLGSVGLLLLAGRRAWTFHRLIAHARRAPNHVRVAGAVLARRMGLSGCPAIYSVPGRISPMLWGTPGRCRILLPGELVERLDVGERDALIAHELAHLRRRDHWVRYLETTAMIGFWWHPVVWWARRNLRFNEERSCDAVVIESLPGRERAYAVALLKTLEFLAGRDRRIPLLATGANPTRLLEERVTMILDAEIPRRLTFAGRAAVALLAVAALAFFPTWADRATEPDRSHEVDESRTELFQQKLRQHEAELREREIELRELEAELREREIELEQREQELRLRDDLADAEGVAQLDYQREAERRAAQAAELHYREALELEERASRSAELRYRRALDDARRATDVGSLMSRELENLKSDLKAVQAEIEAAEAGGDAEAAERLRWEAAERKATLEDFVRAMRAREGASSLDVEHDAPHRTIAEFMEQTEQNFREIERLKSELDRMRAERERHDRGGD